MRVLHVDPATEWRGGQAQLAHLLAGRPGDLLAAVPGSPLASRTRVPDVPLHPRNDPRNALILRAAASRLGVDLVAAHHSHAHDVSLLVPVPLVVHRRNHRPPGHAWKYRRTASVIAVSEFVAGLCRDAGIGRVRVVHDGVDGSPVPYRGGGPRFLGAGALVEHKGFRHAIAAMHQVDGELWIAGDGPLRAELTRIAGPLGGRVRFLGRVDDLPSLFGMAEVFVHPSVEEAAGSVLIEAMVAGIPVVATTAGGQPELVGEAGILVPPADPVALAAALRRPRVRGEGQAQAARFSVEELVQKTTRAYEDALSAPAR